MLETKMKLQKPETDKDKTYYESKFCKSATAGESLDQQIDTEVYKLYNLTDEEIKIVEGE
jgi:hypothetical protein